MPDKLVAKLKSDPLARTRFLADVLNVLEKHGVDVTNAATLKRLGLDHNLNPLAGGGEKASSVVITITQ
jgi:hypothetical protein